MPLFRVNKNPVPNFPFEIDIRPFRMHADLLTVSTMRMARQFGDMNWPLTLSVNKVIIPSMYKNFMARGRPKWKKLSEARIEQKINSGLGVLPFYPLMDTMILFNSINNKLIWRIGRDKADMENLDNLVSYAKYHQAGTRHVPQRQFAVLQHEDIEKIMVIFDVWIRTITFKKDFWPYEHDPW